MIDARDGNREIDAADIEHIGALVAGGLLLLKGMRKSGPLGLIFKLGGVALLYRGQKGYRPLYDRLGIALPHTPTGVGRYNVRVESSIDIDQPPRELYRLWRNLENLPIFMDHLLEVREVDEDRSVWTARAPAGMVVRWEAEIINDVPDEIIAWQSLEGSGVDNAGSVRFEELEDGGTRLRVVLSYDPPGDMLGAWVAKIFQNDPQRQIDNDLRRFKAILELGGGGGESPRQDTPENDGA